MRKTTSPSEARPRAYAAVLVAGLVAVSVPALPAAPAKVRPLAPADGAVTGPRAVFRIGYEETGQADPRRLRFRLTLRPVGETGRLYEFDQRRRPRGWVPGGPGEVLLRPRVPLEDGAYRWEVSLWDGVGWTPAEQIRALRIDSVPPADVDRLTVRADRLRREVVLAWPPVTLDRRGRPEFVARYHVYRYPPGTAIRSVAPHEIGVVEQPRFVDTTAIPERLPLLYYKVIAEDEAGNFGVQP